jgi:hypothetical protein
VDVTPEDFRRHFDMLSDEALIETNRGDLVEIARQCFDEEVARRGLTNSAASPGKVNEVEIPVQIAKFHFRSEFELARALLRSAGIPSHQGNRIGRRIELELPLMVPAEFAEEALELIRSRVSDEELEAEAEESIPEGDCVADGGKEEPE